MGIDKQTKPGFVSILFDDSKEYLDILRKQAEDDGNNDHSEEGKPKQMCISLDNHNWRTEEYYFEDDQFSTGLQISGSLINGSNDTFVSISIPISDEVLIDIMQFGLKKLNKLKSALETLK